MSDPNQAPLRSPPKSARDLLICAKSSGMVVLDNLSRIPAWLSDALCIVSTGGGLAARQLYTDGEEFFLSVQCPVVITSIDSVLTRGDLTDRAILIETTVIPEDRRQDEEDIESRFAREAPRIFGALLEVGAAALQRLPKIVLERKPRMADFARLGVAVEQAMGWETGSFLEAYEGNLEDAVCTPLEAEVITPALFEVLRQHQGIEKWTWRNLDRELRAVAGDAAKRPQWPKNTSELAGRIRTLAPALRKVHGLRVDYWRGKLARGVSITPPPSLGVPAASASPASPFSIPEGARNVTGDGRVTADNSGRHAASPALSTLTPRSRDETGGGDGGDGWFPPPRTPRDLDEPEVF